MTKQQALNAGVRHVGVEGLEPRTLFAGIPQVAGVGYLLHGTTVQRYDIANEKWLAPIALAGSPGGATATHVDAQGIYVAYDRSVVRYNLDGTSPTHLINTNSSVHDIHTDGKLLFLNQSAGLYARFVSIDKTNNLVIDSMENYVDSVYGSSISTTANKIFGRSKGISPADITFAGYDENGHFTAAGASPYHGDYPSASDTWVFPTGAKVVDDSGGVYSATDLTRLNSFASRITDIAFLGADVPIVLSGNNTLTAYSSAILPTGTKTLAQPASQILVGNNNVIAFSVDATSPNGYSTQLVALADLKAPQPGTPVNPIGLAYKPDDIELMANNSLLLLDIETQSIFRWNADTQKYDATIPLSDVPKFMAYSAVNNAVYIAYASGLINSIDLGATTPSEKPFTILPSAALGLSTAGKYVFAVDPSGAWASHYTFAPDGTLASVVDWNYYSSEYIWSAANAKMYFFRDDTSPNDLLSESIGADGKIGTQLDSPLHGEGGFVHPLRVSPDGGTVILGSGMTHDATTLERRVGGLANAVSDIAWLKGTVYTLRSIGGYAQFQQWTGTTYAPGLVAQFPGTPNALISVGDSKLVGIYTGADGVPQFRVMDGSFQPLSPAAPPPAAQTLQAEVATLSGGTVKATNHGGYTGTGFADYAGQGSAAQWTLNWSSAGSATLSFRYTNGGATNRPLSIQVNGVSVGTVACAPTGSWTTWKSVTLHVSLKGGSNTIKATASTSIGGANVDSLTVSASTVEPPPPTGHTGKITGYTFNDADKDGILDGTETRAAGKTVFLDTNNNRKLDTGEKSVITDASGNYSFTGLAAGNYFVRRVFPTGYTYSTPLRDLTLTAGQLISGVTIGSKTI